MNTPVGIAAEPWYLDTIEGAHRDQVGEGFCYAAVPYDPRYKSQRGRLFRLAIVRNNIGGYWPVSDDFYLGYEAEAHLEADRLNRERRKLDRATAEGIIAASQALPPASEDRG